MDDPTKGAEAPSVESLDNRTREQWMSLAGETVIATTGSARQEIIEKLDRARQSEPESPVAPAYGLWRGDSLARLCLYTDAIRSLDVAVETARDAPRLSVEVDATACCLLHKAQAALSRGLMISINGVPLHAEPLSLLRSDSIHPAAKEISFALPLQGARPSLYDFSPA